MLVFNARTLIILFCIGLIIGFGSSVLLYSCNNEKTDSAVTVIPAKEIKRQADNMAAKYQQTIAGLKTKNQQLDKELVSTKGLLAKARQKTAQHEKALSQLIQPQGFPANNLLQKEVSSEAVEQNESPCDSLKQEVAGYLEENKIKDSLYQSQIGILDSTIAVKDTIIAAQENEHQEFYTLFNQSLQQQQLLQKENKQLIRKSRRQKFIGTLKTIGLMILSGATIHFLENH